jgi:hypothetical protein
MQISIIMVLSIMSSSSDKEIAKQTFLLPAQDMLTFCNFIQLWRYTCSLQFHFHIDVHGTLSRSLQRKILVPFFKLQEDLLVQEVQITGKVVTSLMDHVKTEMTQDIGWARGRLWDLYERIDAIIKIADVAFRDREYNVSSASIIVPCTSAMAMTILERASLRR